MTSSTTVSTLGDRPTDNFDLPIAGEDLFRSFTEHEWGEIEAMGFGCLDPGEKKLQFDLAVRGRYVASWLYRVTNIHPLCCSRERRNERRSFGRISHQPGSLAQTRH